MTEQPETVGLEGFDVAIDRDAEVPIGVQLAWALRTRIRDGRFKPSQRLPGLRDLAETIGVNVNTVRAVYQRLEHEGLIDSQQGSGTFVASVQHEPSAVRTIAADAAREAQATGVDPREVAAALYMTSESSAPPVDEATERRRLLRSQIAGLERTLGELEAGHPGLLPATPSARRGAGPTLPERRRAGAGAHRARTSPRHPPGRNRCAGARRRASPAWANARMPASASASRRAKRRPPRRRATTGKAKPASPAKPKPKRAPRTQAGTRPAPAGT